MTFTVGSLFSGIAGLELGLERTGGFRVVWQSEINPHCCRVLAKHWPHVRNLGDIKLIDWSEVEPVDLICGGYPCQPFSLAGKRGGAEDPRHLWPWFRDALCQLRPRYALLENVPGHLGIGFPDVLADLAGLGFDAEWDCIPAAAVGAPHLRYRLFVVAYANGESKPGVTVDAQPRSGELVLADTGSPRRRQDARSPSGDEGADEGRATPNDHVADGDGESGRTGHVADTAHTNGRKNSTTPRPTWPDSADEPERSLGGCPTGADWWAVEPNVGRVAHGIPHRMERLRALGNAVVPQVAEWIGRRILETAG